MYFLMWLKFDKLFDKLAYTNNMKEKSFHDWV